MQDLEFTISEYLDDALPSAGKLALEKRLETDAEARKLLDEYRRLNVAMKSMPMPVFHWETLSRSISEAVDAAHEEHASRSYRMPAWIRGSVMPLALAASLLIVAGVGIELFKGHGGPTGWPANSGVTPAAQSSTVVAFDTDKATGPVEENISIGPGDAVKSEGNGAIMVSYGQDPAAASASHVMVASGVAPAHNTVPTASSFDME